MTIDPIPAIVEAEATGETAMLFAELRAALGVPFVNLVWRHLATIPGALGWTWSLLNPMYASPMLDIAAQELRAGITLRCDPLDGFVYDAVGLGVEERDVIGALIADYNHANAMNFLALSVARRILRGGQRSYSATIFVPSVSPLRVRPPLPRLLGLNELHPGLRSLVVAFDKLGRIAPNPAIASLYRHLCHWPSYLALAYPSLLPLHRDHSLWTQQEQLTIRSQGLIAKHLEPLIRDVSPLPEGSDRGDILKGIESVITGRMTVMGAALLALLPCR